MHSSRRRRLVEALFLFTVGMNMSGCIGAGANSPMIPQGSGSFPVVEGINLHGRTIAIPRELEGERRIVVVAFEQRQQPDVDTWIRGLEEDLKNDSGLKLYELPVIYEGSATFRFWVNNGMRSGITDATARGRTITVYTDRDKFYATLGVKQDSITTFILDREGRITWRADGPVTSDLLAGLRAALRAGA
jgi:hypothetical protein